MVLREHKPMNKKFQANIPEALFNEIMELRDSSGKSTGEFATELLQEAINVRKAYQSTPFDENRFSDVSCVALFYD